VPKTRLPIPKQLRDRVLVEFNHRCAICGTDRPQLHHIDANPANNDPENLLPLCPNCHLVDQHNPTAPIDPLKLQLFRRYKDPIILSAQFHPLFRRLRYLLNLDLSASLQSLTEAGIELIAFVNALKMGGFYHPRIADLVRNSSAMFFPGESPVERQQRLEQHREELLMLLEKNREQVVDLIVEMLRYQDWPNLPRMAGPASASPNTR
jgi:hypothetical protein